MDVELLHDVRPVCLDGLDAYCELLGYGAVAIIFLLLGYFIGEYSERRHIRKNGRSAATDWQE